MAVALMGAVFGALSGIVGASLYYNVRIVGLNRRIRQLEREKNPPRNG